VELRPECLTDWGRNGHEFLRELEERVAQADAEAHPREKGAPALGRAVEPVDQDASDALGGLLVNRGTLHLLIGLRKGCRTGLLGVAQVPEHAAMDNRGEIHFIAQTVAMLFVSQERDGQWETTPGQHGDQTLVAKRTDEAVECHGREMADDGTQCQTEPTVRRQQGVASDLGAHRAIAQDAMRQDGEDGFTLRTLDAPDGEPAQTDPDLMGVAGQAPTAATGRLVGELKAERQHEGEDTLAKRLPIAQQLKVRGFVSQIDGNGTVVSNRFGRCAHRSPLCPQVSEADET